jgi:hypothetical protein
VVETSWELTTVKSGAVYKGLGKQAAQEGYEMFFRHVSPHRHGGVEVRPRMFLIFVPAESVEIAGPLPLFGPSRRPSPTVTVRSILDRPARHANPAWPRHTAGRMTVPETHSPPASKPNGT